MIMNVIISTNDEEPGWGAKTLSHTRTTGLEELGDSWRARPGLRENSLKSGDSSEGLLSMYIKVKLHQLSNYKKTRTAGLNPVGPGSQIQKKMIKNKHFGLELVVVCVLLAHEEHFIHGPLCSVEASDFLCVSGMTVDWATGRLRLGCMWPMGQFLHVGYIPAAVLLYSC